ncbi:MAG: hypothetical protein ACD_28C00228G0002 [uncultured bacterium]|nr:MAG: hypothetical protein ACD_28C00228G0002 [uncultured bacterium]
MSNPFNFKLNLGSKLTIVVLSIFLISLSVGMLVLGNNETLSGNLNTENLKHSSDVLQLFK